MASRHTMVSEKISDYLEQNFSIEDDFFIQLRKEALNKGFPDISIGGVQAGFLKFMIKAVQAERIVEVGSLFGYSALMMAKALPDHGKIYCFELIPEYAEFIKEWADKGGLSSKVEVIIGNALDKLTEFTVEQSVDMVFIDADKPNYSKYLELTYPLVRKNGIIIGDNCLAWGLIADDDFDFEPINVRALQDFNQTMVKHSQIFSTLIPLGDGMCMGVKV